MEELKSSLKCISSIDGRYKNITKVFSENLSEYALFKYRILVEIEYFIFLIEYLQKYKNSFKLNKLTNNKIIELKNIFNFFYINECIKIKKLEIITNHDVKAV